MLAILDELGTVVAVAERVHLTPPAVSMQLTALEREAGVPLTRRRGRRVELTPAGRVLAGHGREITERLSLAERELEALRAGRVGTYHLSAFPSAARTIVADALSVMRERDSALDLRLDTSEPEDAVDDLLAGRADLAIVHSYSNVPRGIPGGILSLDLGQERVRLAVPGDRLSTPRLEDYAESPWIAPEETRTCAVMVERACGLAGFRPRIVARSLDFAVQLAWVAAGAGVALVPDLASASVPEGVVLLEPDVPIHRRLAVIARRPDWADPGLRTLVESLREAASGWLTSPNARAR